MPLDFIPGYITKDTIGDRYLKRLNHRRLKFIDGYISSYCYILNSPKRLEQLIQTNKLVYVLCDLNSDSMR